MVNHVKCTGSDFRGLINPYTGAPIEVEMVITGDGRAFYRSSTYSPAQSAKSFEDLYRAWSRVAGVTGVRKGAPRCAYTGAPLTLHEEDGCFWYSGGFNPSHLWSREEFLYYVTMRDGKAVRAAPEAASSRVVAVLEQDEQPGSTRSAEPEYTEGALEHAEQILQNARVELPRRATVLVPGRKKKGRT